MSQLVAIARKAHMQASRQWMDWLYIAVVVTIVLVLALVEAARVWS